MQPRRSEAFNVWSERVATPNAVHIRFLHSNLLFGTADVFDLCFSTRRCFSGKQMFWTSSVAPPCGDYVQEGGALR
jgi:hypothetical protein